MAQYLNQHGLSYFWSLVKAKLPKDFDSLAAELKKKLSIEDAKNTYLTKDDASATYATKDVVENVANTALTTADFYPGNGTILAQNRSKKWCIGMGNDGVIEIGPYIDMHYTNDKNDYSLRLSLQNGHFTISGAEIWVA